MAKGTGGGTIYLIGLIFAIIVAFVLLGIAYWMNTQYEKIRIDQKTWAGQIEQEQAATKRANEKIAQLNKIIAGENSTVTYDGVASEHLANANRALQDLLSEEWTLAPEWELIKDDTVKGFWKSLAQFKDKQDKYVSLIDFQKDCLQLLRALTHVVPRLRLDVQTAVQEKELKDKTIAELRAQLKAETDDLKDKLARSDDKGLDNARKFDAEKKRLTDSIDKIQKEESRIVAQNSVDIQRKDLENRKLQSRIDQLTKKARKTFYETSKPDGEVTYADASLGLAWIDIGKANGLKRGTRFQVYQYSKGGRQRVKGYCEVKTVDQDSAEVGIFQQGQEFTDPFTGERITFTPDPQDPVVKGDFLRNPIFERNATPKFFFLGQKLGNRFYTREELTRKIEEFGGKVLPTLTVDVDFVIILPKGDEEFPKDYERATQFGATFMKEDELLDYVGK